MRSRPKYHDYKKLYGTDKPKVNLTPEDAQGLRNAVKPLIQERSPYLSIEERNRQYYMSYDERLKMESQRAEKDLEDAAARLQIELKSPLTVDESMLHLSSHLADVMSARNLPYKIGVPSHANENLAVILGFAIVAAAFNHLEKRESENMSQFYADNPSLKSGDVLVSDFPVTFKVRHVGVYNRELANTKIDERFGRSIRELHNEGQYTEDQMPEYSDYGGAYSYIGQTSMEMIDKCRPEMFSSDANMLRQVVRANIDKAHVYRMKMTNVYNEVASAVRKRTAAKVDAWSNGRITDTHFPELVMEEAKQMLYGKIDGERDILGVAKYGLKRHFVSSDGFWSGRNAVAAICKAMVPDMAASEAYNRAYTEQAVARIFG